MALSHWGQNANSQQAGFNKKYKKFNKNPKGGKQPLWKEQCTCCKEERHWKKDCPELKHKKEKQWNKNGSLSNDRKRAALRMNEEAQGLHGTWGAQFQFLHRSPMTVGNELIDFLIDADVTSGGTENISIHLGHGSLWRSTQNGLFFRSLECQPGDLTLEHTFLYILEWFSFGWRSPL